MNRPLLNRTFFAAAFVLGLLSVLWIGAGFIGTSATALVMTALIGGVFLLGALELHRYRHDTAGLATALQQAPEPQAALGDWLARVPAGLRHGVRQRIESERGALPGLALTPYLIGLLVMLGMLGTFLGMVLTFKGVVFTLEGSADLQAIRAALAAPIKGLGLAFGTSVVGVATSAMLGLMSAIARRERAEVSRQLDARVADTLRPFSLAHQRQATIDALQQQAKALPAVVTQLQALVEQVERRGQQLDEQLLARQARFLDSSGEAYQALARSVEQSLKGSLDASARSAAQNLHSAVEQAMGAIVEQTTRHHERVNASLQSLMQAVGSGFEQRSDALMQRVQETLDRSQADHRERLAELQSAMSDQQSRLNEQHTRQLADLSTAFEAPMARLIATAAEAPRAASELVAQRREEMAQLAQRDQQALQERGALLQHIESLLQRVQQGTGEQAAAIESLVASAGAVLDQVGRQFADTVGAHAVRAQDVAAQVNTSAVELASLGRAFGHGMEQFSATNQKLIDSLRGVESAVTQSIARSDEQLAYYVAQAREVIDLSISAQQGIVEDLRRLRAQPVGRQAA
ncbi:MAG TPA: hypothetical protein VLG41_16430 [Hydrogenophaga sp.]|uniref:hypothetical protein n=1 Tax=Hydrogenophaga sp. TaxID=1904254 RepID=UPI002BAAC97E|nr:hypothetical protein [Hydrogenophaga sp.]HSX94518.1 hypothetical protein [Hydrogenophaga sp.]